MQENDRYHQTNLASAILADNISRIIRKKNFIPDLVPLPDEPRDFMDLLDQEFNLPDKPDEHPLMNRNVAADLFRAAEMKDVPKALDDIRRAFNGLKNTESRNRLGDLEMFVLPSKAEGGAELVVMHREHLIYGINSTDCNFNQIYVNSSSNEMATIYPGISTFHLSGDAMRELGTAGIRSKAGYELLKELLNNIPSGRKNDKYTKDRCLNIGYLEEKLYYDLLTAEDLDFAKWTVPNPYRDMFRFFNSLILHVEGRKAEWTDVPKSINISRLYAHPLKMSRIPELNEWLGRAADNNVISSYTATEIPHTLYRMKYDFADRGIKMKLEISKDNKLKMELSRNGRSFGKKSLDVRSIRSFEEQYFYALENRKGYMKGSLEDMMTLLSVSAGKQYKEEYRENEKGHSKDETMKR